VERISELSDRLAVFDTHVSINAKEVELYKGKKYYGRFFAEHSANSTQEERLAQLWSSLDNLRSFWLTKPSLLNLLAHSGFTSVYECRNPSVTRDTADRVTLVAIKGAKKSLLCSPSLISSIEQDWPEKLARRTHPSQRLTIWRLGLVFAMSLPVSARQFLRRLRRRSRHTAKELLRFVKSGRALQ
jgi:hypothetical protein